MREAPTGAYFMRDARWQGSLRWAATLAHETFM